MVQVVLTSYLHGESTSGSGSSGSGFFDVRDYGVLSIIIRGVSCYSRVLGRWRACVHVLALYSMGMGCCSRVPLILVFSRVVL